MVFFQNPKYKLYFFLYYIRLTFKVKYIYDGICLKMYILVKIVLQEFELLKSQ